MHLIAGVAIALALLLLSGGVASGILATPNSGPGRVGAVVPTPLALAVNSSYFDEGGHWNCGQGQETLAFFGDPSGGAAPYRFSWDFGDGTPNASSADPVHTYQALGPYVAHLNVVDSANSTVQSYLAVQWNVPLNCVDSSPPNWSGVVLYGVLLVGAVAFIGGVWRWRRRPPP